MSVLQVYISWANSVLVEVGKEIGSISSVQEGPALCCLIDTLCPQAHLFGRVQPIGRVAQSLYIQTALDHMRNNGIKFSFTVQDIVDGDIKSMLDVLWLLILNYCIHDIGCYTYQRSVGLGKKLLLDWCQKQLNVELDSRNTLTYNLTTGDWFIKLLQTCLQVIGDIEEDKTQQLQNLLAATEQQLLIKRQIIQPADIVDGTVDEHTLMIYISLLKRKAGDKLVSNHTPQYQEDLTDHWTGSGSLEERSSSPDKSSKNTSSASGELTDETVDWFSSSSAVSSIDKFKHKRQIQMDGEQLIMDAINHKVMEDLLPQDEQIPCASTLSKQSLDQTIVSPIDDNNIKECEQLINGSIESLTENSSTSTIELNHADNFQQNSDNPSVKVKRPRTHQSIMAEAREKREMSIELGFDTPEGQKTLFENRQEARKEIVRSLNMHCKPDEELVLGYNANCDIDRQSESVISEEDDRHITIQAEGPSKVVTNGVISQNLYAQLSQGLPVVVLPSQGPEITLLLQALKQSQGEGMTTKLITPPLKNDVEKDISFSSDSEQTELKQIDLGHGLSEAQERYHETIMENDIKTNNGTAELSIEHHLKPKLQLTDLQDKNKMVDYVSAQYDPPPRESNIQYLRRRQRAISPDSFTLQSPRTSSDNSHSQDGSYELPRKDLTLPGRQPDQFDPSDGLIKVLTQEVEILKLKIHALEKHPVSEDQRGVADNSIKVGSDVGCTRKNEQKHARHSRILEVPYRNIDGRVRSSTEHVISRSPKTVEISDGRIRFDETSHLHQNVFHKIPMHNVIDQTLHRPKSNTPPVHPERRTFRSNDALTTSGTRIDRQRETVFMDDMLLSRRPRTRLERGTVSAGATPVRGRSPVVSDLSKEISISQNEYGKMTFSPPRSRPISLGYSSPISKVPQEIWGNEAEYLESIHPKNREKWKGLIDRIELGDEDIIELKQALATAVTENDILQAKLKNANSEITEKMSKTSEVLNECRSHLAKTQAENAELRSQLERERSRADALEARIRELESTISATKADNNDLEAELEGTVGLLKGATRQDVSVLKTLQEEIRHLHQRFDTVQKENTKLREDIDEWDTQHHRSQQTIKDLKSCLDNARQERTDVIGELNSLQNKSRMKSANAGNQSFEKENYEKTEKYKLNGFVSPVSFRISGGQLHGERSSSPYRESSFVSCAKNPATSPINYNECPSNSYRDLSNRSGNVQDDYFFYEEDEPTVPSSVREIYPHRRTSSYINRYGNPYEETDYISPFDIFSNDIRPVSKLDFDLDLDCSYSDTVASNGCKQSNYECFENEKYTSDTKCMSTPVKTKQNYTSSNRGTPTKDMPTESTVGIGLAKSKNQTTWPQYQKYCDDYEITLGDRNFINALNNAVKEEERDFIHTLDSAVHHTRRQCYDDMDIEKPMEQKLSSSFGSGKSSPSLSRTQSESISDAGPKGILKNAKSQQNMSIKRLHSTLDTGRQSPMKNPSEMEFFKKRTTNGTPKHDAMQTTRYQAERPLEESQVLGNRLRREMNFHPHSSSALLMEDRVCADLLIDKYTKIPIKI